MTDINLLSFVLELYCDSKGIQPDKISIDNNLQNSADETRRILIYNQLLTHIEISHPLIMSIFRPYLPPIRN